MPVELGYWKIRGLGANLRYQLAHCGVAFDDKMYETGDAPDYDKSSWLSVKFNLGMEFPNLPYIIDGDHKMSETIPIHKYIADKYKPSLLGSSPEERARINMAAGPISELKGKVTMPCYMSGDKAEVHAAMEARLPAIVKFIGDNKFTCGAEPSWLDFYFFEILELLDWLSDGKVYETHPTLKSLHDNIENLDGVKAVLEGQRKLAFNNKMAKLNNM